MAILFQSPGPEAEFRRRLSAGEFALQCCRACETWVFHPRLLCPACGSERLEWCPASGRGRVHSVAVLRQRPEKGGDSAIVLIDLEEGPRMMSRLPDMRPDDITVAMPVRARIVAGADGPVVVFDADAHSGPDR